MKLFSYRRGVHKMACLLLAMSVWASAPAIAQSSDVTTLRDAREAAEARDQARLQSFLEDQDALAAALEEARAAHAAAEQEQAALQAQQQEQTEQAEALAQRQDEQGEALAALLADLTRHSEELRNELGGESWLTLTPNALDRKSVV